MGLAGMLVLVLVLAAPARAQDVAYETEITGIDDGPVLEALRASSQLVAWQDHPPASLFALRERAKADTERLAKILDAEGYFAASIEFRIDADRRPVQVTISVQPGPPFRLTSLDINPASPDRPLPTIDRGELGIAVGEVVKAAAVLDAQTRLLAQLGEHAHPLAKVTERKVVADHADFSVAIAWIIDPGPEVTFGETAIEGLSSIPVTYAQARLPWRVGQPYDSRLLDKARKHLVDSRLFSSVRLIPGTAPQDNGQLPLTLALAEAKPRSVGTGATYSTSEGFGAKAFWEDRNLFGGAERLRLAIESAQIRKAATAEFRKPDQWAVDQDLFASLGARDEMPDGYRSRALEASLGVERKLTETLSVSAAGAAERDFVEDSRGHHAYTLISTPLGLRRDATDNLLDPSRGSRETLSVTPYPSALGSTVSFVANKFTEAAYWSFDQEHRFILAGRVAIGGLAVKNFDDIPTNKRFYAGGGGSVRGYGYQMAGPVDADRRPIGGRSLLEGGIELRWKVTDTIGIVPFFEAGNVYTTGFPDLKGSLFKGAGLGLRYYTPIGPVRLDLAVPLDRRSGIDDPVQVYISLGQAF